MHTLKNSRAAMMAVALALLPMLSGPAAAHDNHASYSAGEPGDPKKPSREIVIEMGDRFYKPKAIEVKRGEQVRFVLRND